MSVLIYTNMIYVVVSVNYIQEVYRVLNSPQLLICILIKR